MIGLCKLNDEKKEVDNKLNTFREKRNVFQKGKYIYFLISLFKYFPTISILYRTNLSFDHFDWI